MASLRSLALLLLLPAAAAQLDPYAFGTLMEESVYVGWRVFGNTSAWNPGACVPNGAGPPASGSACNNEPGCLPCDGATGVSFVAKGLQPSYALAFGLGGESMVGITAYVGWMDADGVGYVQSYFITDRHAANVYPTGEALRNVSVSRDLTGALTFSFSRNISGSGLTTAGDTSTPLTHLHAPLVWALFKNWTLDAVTGTPTEDSLKHFAHSSGGIWVDMIDGSVAEAAPLTYAYSGSVQLRGEAVAVAWKVLGNTSSWTPSGCVGNGAGPPDSGSACNNQPGCLPCEGATDVAFEVKGLQPSYALAFGLGGESMINITAYVGWVDGAGVGHVQSYYITDHHAANVYPTHETLSDVTIEKDAKGILSFHFTRAIGAGGRTALGDASTALTHLHAPLVWALFKNWDVDAATGSPSSDSLVHFVFSHDGVWVDMITNDVAFPYPLRKEKGILIHAVLMVLAWGVFAPFSVFAARFLKQLGGPGFYQAHLALISVALVCTVAAFVVIYVHTNRTFDPLRSSKHYGGLHSQIGLAVFILTFLQPASSMPFFRPKPPKSGELPSRERAAWELVHKNLGRATLLLSFVAIGTGIPWLVHHGIDSWRVLLALWLGWCVVFLGGAGLTLEAFRRARAATHAFVLQHAEESGGGGYSALTGHEENLNRRLVLDDEAEAGGN